MNKFLQRLREPSTWAGLAVLSAVLGADPQKVAALGQLVGAFLPFVPPDGGGILAHLVTAAAGGIAIMLPETAPAATTVPAVQAPAPVAPIAQ